MRTVEPINDKPRGDAGMELRSLGSDVVVLACDVPARLRTPPRLETLTGDKLTPLTTLRLSLTAGRTRLLWAFRRPGDRTMGLRAFTGVLAAGRLVEIPANETYPPVDFADLLADIEPSHRAAPISALLGVWSSVFKLRRDPIFASAIHSLAATLSAKPTVANAEAGLVDRQALLSTHVHADFGDVQAIYLATDTAVEALPGWHWHLGRETGKSGRSLHLVTRAKLARNARLIIVSASGVAVRRPGTRGPLPALGRWWKPDTDAGLREFIVRCLTELSPAGRAAALEFQIRSPLRPRRASGRGPLPAASVEIAFSGPSGLFVTGWLRDPAHFVDRLEAEDADGVRHPVTWHRYPATISGRADPIPATGFVGFAPTCRTRATIVQPRLYLELASGTGQSLVPRPQPSDPAERRALALKAVPPQHLTADVMKDCLAPALADLQAALNVPADDATVEVIGGALTDPSISVVVPLYRVLDFLRPQVAAFAADPIFAAEAEIIYVLDSPEQAADVRQLLQGLNLLYGTPFTLVVNSRNRGYAPSCNVGAHVARGTILAMLNSDVIPASPGWLALLAGRLTSSASLAACGPKLLFDDNSIQHAGMYFAQNHFGSWLNHHFHKGMPRAFAPATIERLVPAVTGACLVVKRAVFDAVGGFTEDYVIGDYEDSDLCLKLRDAGHDIAYVPGAELYHLERQSIRHNEDYMRGSADRYNAWLHAKRWEPAMRALMAADHAPQLRSAA